MMYSTATPTKRFNVAAINSSLGKERAGTLGERILVTGGAGFIGRTVCRELLRHGIEVRVLDSLIEQVHGDRERPDDFPGDAERIVGDIRNKDVVTRSLKVVDSVIH